MLNAFRSSPNASLDRQYLRTCAIYRLLKGGHIGQSEAQRIAARPIRGSYTRAGWLDRTIEHWRKGPLKCMKP